MNITVQRIKQLAKQQGRSLTYLCKVIGLESRSYFNDIEKNNRVIPDDKLQIIADALGTTTDYLIGNTDTPEPLQSAKPNTDDITSGLTPDEVEELKKYAAFLISKRDKK